MRWHAMRSMASLGAAPQCFRTPSPSDSAGLLPAPRVSVRCVAVRCCSARNRARARQAGHRVVRCAYRRLRSVQPGTGMRSVMLSMAPRSHEARCDAEPSDAWHRLETFGRVPPESMSSHAMPCVAAPSETEPRHATQAKITALFEWNSGDPRRSPLDVATHGDDAQHVA